MADLSTISILVLPTTTIFFVCIKKFIWLIQCEYILTCRNQANQLNITGAKAKIHYHVKAGSNIV